LAWFLATCPNAALRDPKRAVELARNAVELAPKSWGIQNTLGVAHYRAGDWKAAITALEKSIELSQAGAAFDYFFLAMAHWKLGDKAEAKKRYDHAVEWMQKNKEALEKDKGQAEELERFRAEAAMLIRP
jgi:tetratricopeptide (TPR) repeat protein